MISYTHKNCYLIPISFCFQILLLLMIDNVISSFSWGLLAFILPKDTHAKEKAERTPQSRGNITWCVTWGTTHTWKRELIFWRVAPLISLAFLGFHIRSELTVWVWLLSLDTVFWDFIHMASWMALSQLSGAGIVNVLLFVPPLSRWTTALS